MLSSLLNGVHFPSQHRVQYLQVDLEARHQFYRINRFVVASLLVTLECRLTLCCQQIIHQPHDSQLSFYQVHFRKLETLLLTIDLKEPHPQVQ